jgi:hypothetical protein
MVLPATRVPHLVALALRSQQESGCAERDDVAENVKNGESSYILLRRTADEREGSGEAQYIAEATAGAEAD